MSFISVDWEGPFDWDTVISTKTDPDRDCGLYQICTNHLVHGPNTLLYVGKTDRRTFSARLSEHEWWLTHEKDVAIYLGRLRVGDYEEDPGWKHWMAMLGHVEALTVYWHSPPYNSHFIARYSGPSFEVRSVGARGRLLEEYTSDWTKPVSDTRLFYRLASAFVVAGTPHGYPGGPEAWRPHCRDIAKSAISDLRLPVTNPVKIVARFNFRQTAKAWDLDNALKSLIDAIGAAGLFSSSTAGGHKSEWNTDDSLVFRVEAEKLHTETEARTEVEIWLAEPRIKDPAWRPTERP
jgi:Holliday junction resolvase RusA-like endonuclease